MLNVKMSEHATVHQGQVNFDFDFWQENLTAVSTTVRFTPRLFLKPDCHLHWPAMAR
jgi:hypothetical protein